MNAVRRPAWRVSPERIGAALGVFFLDRQRAPYVHITMQLHRVPLAMIAALHFCFDCQHRPRLAQAMVDLPGLSGGAQRP